MERCIFLVGANLAVISHNKSSCDPQWIKVLEVDAIWCGFDADAASLMDCHPRIRRLHPAGDKDWNEISSTIATLTAGNTPKRNHPGRHRMTGTNRPCRQMGTPSNMGFGMFLSGYCDTKCWWKMSHLHRINMMKWQDGRRAYIKPTRGTKNDGKKNML